MSFRLLLLVFLLSFCSGCSLVGLGGSDYLIQAEAGMFQISPDGNLALEDSGGATLNNSLEDLGLDDSESRPYAKASLRLGSNEISLSGFQMDSSGTGTVTAAFGNITAGTPVVSSLEMTNAKLLYRWYLVDLPMISVGPGIGFDYIDINAKATASSLSLTEEFDGKAPIPMPGISAEFRLGGLRAFADLYGMKADVSDIDGTFLDLEGGLRYSPISKVEATVGYRLISIDISGKDGTRDFDVDYSLPGLFFSAGIRF